MKSTLNWEKLRSLINRNVGAHAVNSIAGLDVREVIPIHTDPTIDNWNEPHMVATPNTSADSGYLVLFLCGSYGKPRRQLSIMKAMVDQGHHVVNLRYPNDWTIGGICRNQQDTDCHQKIRRHIITGQEETHLLRISPQNSILNRLTKLLALLSTQDRESNWSQFMDASARPNWSRIIVAGHSQGGGHALMISKMHQVARCVMFSAPADCIPPLSEPAPWIAHAGATPPDNCYGFCHTQDRIFPTVADGWNAIGLHRFGNPVCVDDSEPPYAGSHMLITRTRVPAANCHGCVATDRTTPQRQHGIPLFLEAWHYLFALPSISEKNNG